MKTIDFSHTGGFPLDADALDFMQGSYMEIMQALFADVPANTLVVVSGALLSYSSSSGHAVSDGWVYYNSKLYKLTGGSYGTGLVLGATECIVLADTTGTAIFQNGSTNTVYHTGTASPQLVPSGAAAIPLASMKTWHQYLAGRVVGSFTSQNISAAVAGGAVAAGTIYYRKNMWTRQFELYGSLTISNAQSITATPYYSSIVSFTDVTIVSSTIPFACYIRYHGSTGMVYDQLGNQMLHINGDMYNGGSGLQINIGALRPSNGLIDYTVYFNTTAPLA